MWQLIFSLWTSGIVSVFFSLLLFTNVVGQSSETFRELLLHHTLRVDFQCRVICTRVRTKNLRA